VRFRAYHFFAVSFPWDASYINADLFIDIIIQCLFLGIYFARNKIRLNIKAGIIILLVFIAYISDLIEIISMRPAYH
jgi:hypothetical protein